MARVFRQTYTKPIPADAEIVTRDGKLFARFKARGKLMTAPITEKGDRVRIETECY